MASSSSLVISRSCPPSREQKKIPDLFPLVHQRIMCSYLTNHWSGHRPHESARPESDVGNWSLEPQLEVHDCDKRAESSTLESWVSLGSLFQEGDSIVRQGLLTSWQPGRRRAGEMRERENVPVALSSTPTPHPTSGKEFISTHSSSRQGCQGHRSCPRPTHRQDTERDRQPSPFPSHSIQVCRL